VMLYAPGLSMSVTPPPWLDPEDCAEDEIELPTRWVDPEDGAEDGMDEPIAEDAGDAVRFAGEPLCAGRLTDAAGDCPCADAAYERLIRLRLAGYAPDGDLLVLEEEVPIIKGAS